MTPEEKAAFNGHVTGEIQYFDPASIYNKPKNIWRNAHYVFAAIVGMLLLIAWGFFSLARADELQDFKGKPLSIFAALCSERADADTLLGHVEHGGTPEGVAYMQAADNTCTLTPMDVVVGDTLSEATDPHQVVWLLVSVASLNGQSNAFMVSMKVLKTNVKSSDI